MHPFISKGTILSRKTHHFNIGARFKWISDSAVSLTHTSFVFRFVWSPCWCLIWSHECWAVFRHSCDPPFVIKLLQVNIWGVLVTMWIEQVCDIMMNQIQPSMMWHTSSTKWDVNHISIHPRYNDMLDKMLGVFVVMERTMTYVCENWMFDAHVVPAVVGNRLVPEPRYGG